MSTTTGRKRILCVEDDLDSCELLTVLLRDHEVLTAPTVKKALQLARVERFDLYVLDGTYPDGSGIELCQQIRSFDPSTPIVFFSGLTEDSTIQEAFTAGAQAYLTKPDDFDALLPKVEELLMG